MGYSQEGSVFLSQKTRSSEQFLSLESTKKVQCFNINKITSPNTQKTVKKFKNYLIQANCRTNSYILTLPQPKELHTNQDTNANACHQLCTRFSHLRTFTSSAILALHPHVFHLFLFHLFSSEPQHIHMKTCLLQHFQLHPVPYLTDTPLMQELQLDQISLFPLPSPPPSKSNQVLLRGITTLLLFSSPVPMADMAVSVSTPIFYSEINQKKLFLFPLLIGLQKQPLDFDKKWLRLAARDFCRSGNLALFHFVREGKNSSRSEALTRTGQAELWRFSRDHQIFDVINFFEN